MNNPESEDKNQKLKKEPLYKLPKYSSIKRKKRFSEWLEKKGIKGIAGLLATYSTYLFYFVIFLFLLTYILYDTEIIQLDRDYVNNIFRYLVIAIVPIWMSSALLFLILDDKKKKDNNGLAQNIEKKHAEPSKPKENMVGASGTGFIINRNGYIVTNYHVIERASKIHISTKYKESKARVFATDKINDLAILRTYDSFDDYFKLSENDADRMDEVTAVGYGFGKSMSDEIKTTRGVVSAVAGIGNNYSQYQIDAALQPGNSGGPVIDSGGNVIGVAVAKADAVSVFNHTGTIAEGISFAIKSSTLKQFLKSNGVFFETSKKESKEKLEINKLIDNAALFIYY